MPKTGVARRRSHRGIPLWLYLAALVLVPLVGVGVLTAVVAQARTDEADSAARAEAAVAALAQLDAARNGVEQEIVPVLSLTVIDDPEVAQTLGLPPALLTAQRAGALAQLAGARQMSDRALAAIPEHSIAGPAADRAVTALAQLRADVDVAAVPLEETYLRYLAVATDLATAQREAADAATSEGLPTETVRAIRDVQTIAELTQQASQQLPLFLAAQFASGDGALGSRTAWQTAWVTFTDAQRQMSTLSQEALRDAWDEFRSHTAVIELDAVLAVGAAGAGSEQLAFQDVVRLLNNSNTRYRLLETFMATAVDAALDRVSADLELADQRLARTLQLSIGLLLAALVGILYLGRSVSRSLGLLAGQARQISEGSLVDVEVTGPREVRTVSTALGAAVGGLRRIQDQAQAVARGDLDNALLDQPLPGPLGEVVHASVREIVNSVRQREELQFALAHQATHDPLTGLPNRAQALTLVTSALHRGRRSGEMTGLLFVDLDGFKSVNDGHGHAAGDGVLAEVGRRLRDAVRPGDVVCRLGGDEFVVLVEPVHSESDLLELADRLIAAVSRPITFSGQQFRIGASVGIAVSRDGGTDADVLFAEADTAAYRAKQHGRGRAEIFDDALREQLGRRAEMEAAITAALADGEMQLHYQPVVDVAQDRIIGYEALIRWNRPGHGLVPPDQFIPVAEASRLICELDRWVLHEATRQLAEWRAADPASAGRTEPTIAVNISGRHLADRRVVTDVADALAASGLPPELLIIEVTETVLVDDPQAFGHLAELRAMGVGVAIDDFGTGYTSIGQLRHMPVDTLKIDRSFVASADPGHRELVALIIRAAHTFGLTVVAEGVEEPAQLARLKEQSCDLAQGYLLYRPMPAADAGALLQPATPLA